MIRVLRRFLADNGLADRGLIDKAWADTNAATAVEYALMAGGIAVVIAAAVNLLGANLLAGYTDLATKLN